MDFSERASSWARTARCQRLRCTLVPVGAWSPSASPDLGVRDSSDDNDSNVHSLDRLQSVREFVRASADGYTFNVESLVPDLCTVDNTPVFVAEMQFCDSIQDAWFVTGIVRELTRKFPLAAALNDDDGEFLLIEGSKELPQWVTPASTKNRVLIYQGDLHIIPQTVLHHAESVTQSAKVLSTTKTRASQALQDAIWNRRLAGFPDDMQRESRHVTVCAFPTHLHQLFRKFPELGRLAAHAFQHGSPESLTIAIKAAEANIRRPNTRLARTCVVLSRCHYARLAFAATEPSRAFRSLPRSSALQGEPEIDGALRMGTRLCIGLHLLLLDLTSVQQDTESSDLYFNPERLPSNLLQSIELALQQEVGCGGDDDDKMEGSSTSWMEIAPDEIEELLEAGRDVELNGNSMVDSLVEHLNAFVVAESGLDGIEVGTPGDTCEIEPISFDFEKLVNVLSGPTDANTGDHREDQEETNTLEVERAMDTELQEHPDIHETMGDAEPDVHIAQHFLTALALQQGSSGPASTLLDQLGFGIEDDVD